MLKVSIHAGDLDQASRFNLVAWLDIGYDKLAPIADYKTVLVQNGTGAAVMAPIYQYPRWSATLWDLVARALALGLRDPDDVDVLNPEVPLLKTKPSRFAFIGQMCAQIEHLPPTGEQGRRTLATVVIKQAHRRGFYTARFGEHTMPPKSVGPFEYKPEQLRTAELLLHACLHRLDSPSAMPPPPGLILPASVTYDGKPHTPLHCLLEPAQTGFLRWLSQQGETPTAIKGMRLGIVPEALYVRFLGEAV